MSKKKLARRAESREGMVVMTVGLPKELHHALRLAALEGGTTVNQILRAAAEAYLKGGRK